MQILIVSGTSGSGKSLAIKALEDIGFYCIDNLPVLLIQECIKIVSRSNKTVERLALVVDARNRSHLDQLPRTIRKLKRQKSNLELVFLESSEAVLIRRFSETRRKHPLAAKGSILQGLRQEREILAPIRKMADVVIDTSDMKGQDLRRHLLQVYGRESHKKNMVVSFMSFGFKYGIPLNADIVLDVRFIKNPFFEKGLNTKTGLDKRVVRFVLDQPDIEAFLHQVEKLIIFLLPKYESESRSYLSICIGCTGGKHRSVVVASELAKRIQARSPDILVDHRDIELE